MRAILRLLAPAGVAVVGVVVLGLALAAADLDIGQSPVASGIALAPSPSSWLIVAPGNLQMPAGADCTACHETTGGVIGIKDIPAIPHPVERWGTCTACHDNARLVQTAPGHTGIHAEQCQVCHTVSLGHAPAPAHAALPNFDCVSCHGSSAPLPEDMAHRRRDYCWLCHLSPNPAPTSGALPASSTPPTSAPQPTGGSAALPRDAAAD